MKITFNVVGCGLENNGGSITILKSANTLIDLGHEVTIIDHRDNEYTWGVVKAEHKIIKSKEDIPDADVIIATGFSTVRKMLHWPDRCGKKFHWIRGWETWNYPEWYIEKKILQYPVTKLVNGIQLQEKLARCGVEAHLVRPGYDFEDFSLLNVRGKDSKIILGGLYCTGRKRKGKRTDWILKAAEQLKKKHSNLELWMYGLPDKPSLNVIDRYFKNPTPTLKNQIYNLCDIWLAPTMLEGLHMPPAEAMLTLCPVVGTNAELSGMSDYLVPCITGIRAENNLTSFVVSIEKLIKHPDLRMCLGGTGRSKIMGLGNRETNMQKMVEVLNGESNRK